MYSQNDTYHPPPKISFFPFPPPPSENILKKRHRYRGVGRRGGGENTTPKPKCTSLRIKSRLYCSCLNLLASSTLPQETLSLTIIHTWYITTLYHIRGVTTLYRPTIIIITLVRILDNMVIELSIQVSFSLGDLILAPSALWSSKRTIHRER